jgi:hypothetical protein
MFSMKLTRVQIFERQALAALEKPIRRWAFQAGGYIRTVMKNSIEPRIGVSEPGQPPHSHGRGTLRNNIRFAVLAAEEKVIIGPRKLKRKVGQQPQALEHGGKTEARRKRKKRTQTVKARPFALPALKKSTTRVTRMWKNAVTSI